MVVVVGGTGAVANAGAVPSSRVLGSTAVLVPIPNPVSLVSGVVPTAVESRLLSEEEEEEDLEYAQGTISRRRVMGGSSGFISCGISVITHFPCIHTQKNP